MLENEVANGSKILAVGRNTNYCASDIHKINILSVGYEPYECRENCCQYTKRK